MEIERDSVLLSKELGEGQFGKVFEATASDLVYFDRKPHVVAVKFLNTGLDMQDQVVFIQEAVRMKELNHAHVVRLLGVCFRTMPGFIVLEHMSKGDLKAVLQASKFSTTPFSVEEMTRMAAQVASARRF